MPADRSHGWKGLAHRSSTPLGTAWEGEGLTGATELGDSTGGGAEGEAVARDADDGTVVVPHAQIARAKVARITGLTVRLGLRSEAVMVRSPGMDDPRNGGGRSAVSRAVPAAYLVGWKIAKCCVEIRTPLR